MAADSVIVAKGSIAHLWDNWITATEELIRVTHPVSKTLSEKETRRRNAAIDLSVLHFAFEMVKEIPETTPGRKGFKELCSKRERQALKEVEAE